MIVSEEHIILGIGYNGFPRGCPDSELPWAKKADDILGTKYPYVRTITKLFPMSCGVQSGCAVAALEAQSMRLKLRLMLPASHRFVMLR